MEVSNQIPVPVVFRPIPIEGTTEWPQNRWWVWRYWNVPINQRHSVMRFKGPTRFIDAELGVNLRIIKRNSEILPKTDQCGNGTRSSATLCNSDVQRCSCWKYSKYGMNEQLQSLYEVTSFGFRYMSRGRTRSESPRTVLVSHIRQTFSSVSWSVSAGFDEFL
jgi:hypothetical protein